MHSSSRLLSSVDGVCGWSGKENSSDLWVVELEKLRSEGLSTSRAKHMLGDEPEQELPIFTIILTVNSDENICLSHQGC